MKERLFTLEEANHILPLIRSITRDAVRRYRDAKNEIEALELLKTQRRAGIEVPKDSIVAQDARIECHLNELRRLIEEIERLGARLRDYERGAVAFPAAAWDEGFVYWSWMLGESQVSHCHRAEESFDQRRPVPAPAQATPRG